MGGLNSTDGARALRRLRNLSVAFSPAGMKPDLNKLGVLAKAEVGRAVVGDIGDLSMSNWRRGKPIQVTGRFDVDGSKVTVTPAPRARGPMRVLEDGRQARGAQSKVSFRTLKSGAVKARRGKTTARGGATRGRGTWTDAAGNMDRTVRVGLRKQGIEKWRKALSS
jgi:hypothetical protein